VSHSITFRINERFPDDPSITGVMADLIFICKPGINFFVIIVSTKTYLFQSVPILIL
jgi:hypothetical protein